MDNRKGVKQIWDTPLSISVYSVGKTATQINPEGILQIIFCVKGSVCISYSYEEFVLTEGEYISIDKDAYYLYDGKDNICVSLYIDLSKYEEKFGDIKNYMFVCEGCRASKTNSHTKEHMILKGLIILLLKCINDSKKEYEILEITEKIVYLFITAFDIFFYYVDDEEGSEEARKRLHLFDGYMFNNMNDKITIKEISEKYNLTESYISEYMRNKSIGFRNILSYLRANESERLLLKTDKTILEISSECGFSDPRYYYTAFKKWYKCTPNEFRKQYRNSVEDDIHFLSISSIKEVIDEHLQKHYMDIFLGKNSCF